jgi:hypothetical protein
MNDNVGKGMAISVAPLITTVMNAVPDSESGLASGVNNAVSRLASLLAVAAFGAVLVTVSNHSLDQHLSQLALSARIFVRRRMPPGLNSQPPTNPTPVFSMRSPNPS